MKINSPLTFSLLLMLAPAVIAQIPPSISVDKESETAHIKMFIPTEGKEYITLRSTAASQPAVIEFFSFYCGACYKFVKDYPVTDAINRILPAGESVTKYHVDAMGPLGNELTEAWSIAILMGKTHELEIPLFEATQNRKLNSIDDIKALFNQAGINAETYESSRNSLMVKGLIAKQQAAMAAFDVRSTPTFYIAGKYKMYIGGIEAKTPEAYADNFAKVVHALIQ